MNKFCFSLLAIILFTASKKVEASDGWLEVKGGWQSKSLSDISQLKLEIKKNCNAAPYLQDNSRKLSYDIQKYLGDWGIPMVEGEASESEPYINVSIICEQADYSYHNTIFQLEVIQPVDINGEKKAATTYKNQVFGITGSYFNETEQRVVLNLLKQFVKDWELAK